MYSEHDDRVSQDYDRNSRNRGRGRRGQRGSHNNNNYRRPGRGGRGYNNSNSIILNEDESMGGNEQGSSGGRL